MEPSGRNQGQGDAACLAREGFGVWPSWGVVLVWEAGQRRWWGDDARASRRRGAPASQPPAAHARARAQPAPIRREERKTTPKRPGQPAAHGRSVPGSSCRPRTVNAKNESVAPRDDRQPPDQAAAKHCNWQKQQNASSHECERNLDGATLSRRALRTVRVA
jgi:hypothetical protein